MDKGQELLNAVKAQNETKVNLLLAQNADPNYVDSRLPPFYGSLYFLKGPPFHAPPLFVALEKGNSLAIVESLILFNANLDFRVPAWNGPSLSYLMSAFDVFGNLCHKKTNALLHHGLLLDENDEKHLKQKAYISSDILLTANSIMRERIARCRKACVALYRRAPFQQRDLKIWCIKTMIWPTRHDAIWTPDMPMPDGYT